MTFTVFSLVNRSGNFLASHAVVFRGDPISENVIAAREARNFPEFPLARASGRGNLYRSSPGFLAAANLSQLAGYGHRGGVMIQKL